MFTLHLVFIPRINDALHECMETFNHHSVRTDNWCPYILQDAQGHHSFMNLWPDSLACLYQRISLWLKSLGKFECDFEVFLRKICISTVWAVISFYFVFFFFFCNKMMLITIKINELINWVSTLYPSYPEREDVTWVLLMQNPMKTTWINWGLPYEISHEIVS